MLQTIFLFIAVFLLILGIFGYITNILKIIHNSFSIITGDTHGNFIGELILITIGLTYIIWYYN